MFLIFISKDNKVTCECLVCFIGAGFLSTSDLCGQPTPDNNMFALRVADPCVHTMVKCKALAPHQFTASGAPPRVGLWGLDQSCNKALSLTGQKRLITRFPPHSPMSTLLRQLKRARRRPMGSDSGAS